MRCTAPAHHLLHYEPSERMGHEAWGLSTVDARQASSATYELPHMDFIEPDRGGGRPESGWKEGGHGDKQRATNVIRTTSRGMGVCSCGNRWRSPSPGV
jgi:hypothetical protein